MEKRCVECIECYEYNSQEEMELHRREAEQLGHISNDPPYEEQKEEEAHPDTTRIPVKSTTGILKNQKLHILLDNPSRLWRLFYTQNSPATCRAYTLYQLYLRDPDYSLEGIILLLYYVEHVVDPVGIRELYAPRLLRHVSCAVPDFRESYLPPLFYVRKIVIELVHFYRFFYYTIHISYLRYFPLFYHILCYFDSSNF